MNGEVVAGSVLDGRFRITSLISKGALSSVFEAVDDATGRRVAVKVPLPGAERDPLYLWRFEREERIGASLDHPQVLRIYPVEKKTRPYIVMERLEGTPLSNLLKEGKPVPVPQALRIAAQIARALEYLHGQKVVHRDLKPANVILSEGGAVRLIDLGLAKAGEGPEAGPAVSRAFGTPDYMPPEQVMGKSGDARSDIYTLGAVLYEMVTGYPPFRGENLFTIMHARVVGDPPAPSHLCPDVTPQVEEIILQAMERDPRRRFASAENLRKALENPGAVPLTGRASRLRAPAAWKILWRRTREFVWALLAMLGFIALITLVAWKWGKHR